MVLKSVILTLLLYCFDSYHIILYMLFTGSSPSYSPLINVVIVLVLLLWWADCSVRHIMCHQYPISWQLVGLCYSALTIIIFMWSNIVLVLLLWWADCSVHHIMCHQYHISWLVGLCYSALTTIAIMWFKLAAWKEKWSAITTQFSSSPCVSCSHLIAHEDYYQDQSQGRECGTYCIHWQYYCSHLYTATS